MGKKMYLSIIFLSLCLLLTPALSSFAQEEEIPESQDSASAYLVTLGERAYQKGRPEEAIREFSKALMLDPTNQQAKQRLQELGVSEDMLPAQALDPARLNARVRANEDKVKELTRQKIILEEELKTFKADNSRLAQEKINAQERAKALEEKQQTPEGTAINVLEDYLEVREKELQALEEELRNAQVQIEILEKEKGDASAGQ